MRNTWVWGSGLCWSWYIAVCLALCRWGVWSLVSSLLTNNSAKLPPDTQALRVIWAHILAQWASPRQAQVEFPPGWGGTMEKDSREGAVSASLVSDGVVQPWTCSLDRKLRCEKHRDLSVPQRSHFLMLINWLPWVTNDSVTTQRF